MPTITVKGWIYSHGFTDAGTGSASLNHCGIDGRAQVVITDSEPKDAPPCKFRSEGSWIPITITHEMPDSCRSCGKPL